MSRVIYLGSTALTFMVRQLQSALNFMFLSNLYTDNQLNFRFMKVATSGLESKPEVKILRWIPVPVIIRNKRSSWFCAKFSTNKSWSSFVSNHFGTKTRTTPWSHHWCLTSFLSILFKWHVHWNWIISPVLSIWRYQLTWKQDYLVGNTN